MPRGDYNRFRLGLVERNGLMHSGLRTGPRCRRSTPWVWIMIRVLHVTVRRTKHVYIMITKTISAAAICMHILVGALQRSSTAPSNGPLFMQPI